VAVAYARQLPREDCSVIERYTRQFNYPDSSRVKGKEDIPELGIKTFFCSDVCAAYRRDVFETLGGFESPVIFNEDMFFAARAIQEGYAVAYAADARVVHSHNYSVSQQFHRNFDLAVSQMMHPEIFEQISSEAEGMKLVKNTMKYLFHIGRPYLIWNLGWQCVGKYAGYLVGKRYKKLSRRQILRCTMNQNYWKHIWNEL
jgi:rhamnosyltransferase